MSRSVTIAPGAASPPKIEAAPTVRGWVALVLAVSARARLSHIDILQHKGRSSKRLVAARRLLAWSFMEVAALPEGLATAWLEQQLRLGRRSVADSLRGAPPAELAATLATYSRLVREMGDDDVADAVAAGVMGEQRPRMSVWTRGLMKRLGLT